MLGALVELLREAVSRALAGERPSAAALWALCACVLCFSALCVVAVRAVYMRESAEARRRRELREARALCRAMMDERHCFPLMLRLAWTEASSYDKVRGSGGCDGRVRFYAMEVDGAPHAGGADDGAEVGGSTAAASPSASSATNSGPGSRAHLSNGQQSPQSLPCRHAYAGLGKAVDYLQPIKDHMGARISWADLIQMAGAEAVRATGGPIIPMRYGRVDATAPHMTMPEMVDTLNPPCPVPSGNGAYPDGSRTAADHLRNVFFRLGLNQRELVALSGAHTLGRAFRERSGVVENGYGAREASAYTGSNQVVRADRKAGVGMPGGKSWTKTWLTFDNAYFNREEGDDPDLLWMPTDRALQKDPNLRPFFERYSWDEEVFFRDFRNAFKKMSELGATFDPPEGISINDDDENEDEGEEEHEGEGGQNDSTPQPEDGEHVTEYGHGQHDEDIAPLRPHR